MTNSGDITAVFDISFHHIHCDGTVTTAPNPFSYRITELIMDVMDQMGNKYIPQPLPGQQLRKLIKIDNHEGCRLAGAVKTRKMQGRQCKEVYN